MHRDRSISSALLLSIGLGVSALVGCFQPELPAGQFKCDQPGDACPSGQACISGVCQSRADDPNAPVEVDMATAAPPPAQGCSGAGVPLGTVGGKDAHACAGSFSSPNSAGSLCASGYHVCKSSDSALLADAHASGRCDVLSIGGFFAADVPAGYDASGALICEPTTAVAVPALVGCGADQGIRSNRQPCQDLVAAAPCDGTVSDWSCTSGLSTATHRSGKSGGVLCCQN